MGGVGGGTPEITANGINVARLKRRQYRGTSVAEVAVKVVG